MNRRADKRVEINHPITVAVGNEKARGTLINMSTGGALIRLPADSPVAADCLGEMGSFLLKPSSRPMRKYSGELIRHYVRNDHNWIVLRFWKPYEELPER
jgi:hypothetical protein